MKIGLDVRMIQNSGIGTTIRTLLDHTSAERLKGVTLYSGPDFRNSYPCGAVTLPDSIYTLRQHWRTGRFLNRQNLNLYHMPHYDVPLSYRGPLVATVHDLIHILFPRHSTKPFASVYARVMLRSALRRSRVIIADSENTRRDIATFFPAATEKIQVIHPAVEDSFKPAGLAEKERVLKSLNLKEGYLLSLGNLRESKNTRRLIEVHAALRRVEPAVPVLVLAGKNFLKEFEMNGFPDGIRHLGTVPAMDRAALYSGAALFVFPSLYEGFGLPPVEAMACGVPVIASNRASLPEACGEAALYVNPDSPEEMIQAIKTVLGSREKRNDMIGLGFEQAKKFTPQRFVDRTWAVYDEVLKAGGRR